jgi:hypothetical protein
MWNQALAKHDSKAQGKEDKAFSGVGRRRKREAPELEST